MKKLVCAAFAVVFLLSIAMCGCTPVPSKTPDKYEGVKWVTPDYSLRFNPDDDYKGNYTYNNVKYNIQVEFDGSRVTATDIDKDQKLFDGDWMFEEGEHLYIHGVKYNTSDYEELKGDFQEFFRLHKEKIKTDDDEDSESETE